MRILFVNAVCGTGSTGRIAAKIASEYEAKGWEVKFGYGRDPYVPESCQKWAVRIGSSLSVRLHGLLTRLFDLHGTGICSRLATKKFLNWVEAWKPDMVWLHNLHGYYLNYELLFAWIKRHPEIEVRWNIHDCWPYTGHCSHFQVAGCDRWKTGCFACPEKKEYPATFGLSAAKSNWERKRRAFTGVNKLTVITPSRWLADLTRQSFLGEYPIEIHKHPLDTSVFKPTVSDFRERMGLKGKTIILGVASVWDRRKGLADFFSLHNLLSSKNDKISQTYTIILVGLNEHQISSLPPGIIGMARTNSAVELAEIYTAADWYFNPTHEDIFSMTNMEAAACGCKVATYDTGGAPEAIEGYDKAWVLKGEDKCPEGFVRLLSKEMEAK